ncbi:hypothetical protein ACIQM0_14925 [Streptomyces sp. NPDC091387]|uniref:hypothetical protein n=1 Tax=Streptomyces sp. NPDC091387 TaxID=3365998 RepID=UPI003800D71B
MAPRHGLRRTAADLSRTAPDFRRKARWSRRTGADRTGTASYRSALRTPGAAAIFLAAAPARAGVAMVGFGIVWLVHAETGSFGVAGLVTGSFAAAETLVGPQAARLMDRFGQPRVLVPPPVRPRRRDRRPGRTGPDGGARRGAHGGRSRRRGDQLGLALLLPGAGVAPCVIVSSTLVDSVMDRSVLTQAFTWTNSASAAGIAVSAAAVGRLVDGPGGTRTGFAVPLLVLTATAVLTWSGRHALTTADKASGQSAATAPGPVVERTPSRSVQLQPCERDTRSPER